MLILILRLLLCNCLYFSAAIGHKPLSLSIDEAVNLSLNKSVVIKSAKLSRIAEKFALVVAEKSFTPRLSLRLDGNLAEVTQEKISFDNSKVNVIPGLSLATKIGTSITVGLPYAVNQHGEYILGSNLTITQPLLKGSGYKLNTLSLKKAYDNEALNRLKLKNTVSRAVVDTAKSYRALIANNYQLQASSKSLADAKKAIVVTEAKIKAGRVPATEMIQAQAQMEALQLSLLKITNQVNSAKQNLLTSIGLKSSELIEVPDDISISIEKVPSLEQAIAIALASNFEYRQILQRLTDSNRGLLVAKDDTRLDLQLKYEASLPYIGTNVNDNATSRHSLKFDLKIPINDYRAKSTLLNAKINLENTKIAVAEQKRRLIADVQSKLFNIKNLETSIAMAKKSLNLAEQSYEVEKIKLETGKSTSLNLTTVQDKVLSAKTSLIQAKISFEDALDDLSILLGNTLEQWDIKLEY